MGHDTLYILLRQLLKTYCLSKVNTMLTEYSTMVCIYVL